MPLLHTPQRVVLFTLCKVESGRTNRSIVDEYFGGDYARWSLGYPWMLHCVSNRYEDIIGNQGLTQYVCEFKHYHKAIE